MQRLTDYFEIKAGSVRRETITHGNLTLYHDTRLQNDAGLTYKGVIVSKPEKLSNNQQNLWDTKSCFDVNYTDKAIKDLPPPIAEVGDTVYFEYNAIKHAQVAEQQGNYYIHYKDLLAVIRRGEIVSQGDNVVLEPILLPQPKSGIMLPDKYDEDHAIVVSCRPEHNLKKGDKVLMIDYSTAEYEIEGKTYFVTHIMNILARWKN